MKNKTLFYEGVYLLYTFLNLIMYLSSIASYIQFNRYIDSSIPHKTAVFIFFMIVLEFISFILLSGSISKNASPFQKLYSGKLKLAYFSFFLLIGLRFITLSMHQTISVYVYIAFWALLGTLSTSLYLYVYRRCSALVKNEPQKCQSLIQEYALTLSEEELNLMKTIKRSLLILGCLYVISAMFINTFCTNKITFIAFSIIYMIVVYKSLIDVFRYYDSKRAVLWTLVNTLCSGLGCLAVWLCFQKVIPWSILSDRSLDELVILLLVFLLPSIIWLNSKYKRYQRHKLNQLADSFLRGNKYE